MNSNFISFSISILLLFSFTTTPFAQKVKYGKVSKKELEMTVYDKDPEAEAVILYEKQYIDFVYTNDAGFKYQLKRHIRIKILKKSGLNFADVPISLYHSSNSGSEEKLLSFKAATFNLLDGKIKKDKIDRKEIFKEKSSKYFTHVKYAMPNVQEGSVIDINYVISSPFLFEFTSWEFQYQIPVVKSVFFAEIPEYFIYKTALQGYESASITQRKTGQGSRVINSSYQSYDKRGGRTSHNSETSYITKHYDWVAEHVPALNKEPYMAASLNYLSKIDFELESTNFPNSFGQNFNRTWEDVRLTLMKDDDYGMRLNKKRHVKSLTAELTKDLSSTNEKVAAIYTYVQNNIKWNEKFSHLPKKATKKLLEGEEGFSSDVNFFLLQMLRAANITAYPVSISTRSNGFVNPVTPRITQFNHVIAAVKIDGNFLLLDATDPYAPMGMLPEYDINERGRLFTSTGSEWISLDATKKYKTITQAKLNLNKEGIFEGSIKMLIDGYAAKKFRNRIEPSSKNTLNFINSQNTEDEEGLEIDSSSFKNTENIYKKIIASYDLKINNKAIPNGDLIYFEPLLFFGVKQNPFTSKDRKFPIDFAFSTDKTFILQLTIPEGYAIEELPENISFSLPDNGGLFVYEFQKVNDHLLQLTNKVKIKKTFFLPKDYLPFREFYNLIIEKQGEQVVLKKVE